MNPDELRDRLADIDPARSVETEPVTTPSSRFRLERIMRTDTSSDQHITTPAPADRKRWIVAAAAAAVAIAIGGAVIVGTDGDDTVTEAGPALELDLGESNSMMSCLALSAEILADMPVAFAGTATEVDGDAVTLAVDHWYVGGDATSVVLHAPAGMQALIDGFEFAEGTEYLVSATDGTVNFCGYSGPTTPELQTVYDEAFGS